MDGEKRLWEYSGPSKAGVVIGVLFLVAALVCAVMMGLTAARPQEEPKAFSSLDDKPDSYCTLNIVGVSEPVMKRDSERWYLAEAENGYFYLVKLKSSQFNKMTDQQTYWNEEGKKPAPVAVNGLAKTITAEMFRVLVEGENMTAAQARDILGSYYLDATASPKSENMAGLLGGLFLFGLFGVILTAQGVSRRKVMRANLEALGGAYAVEQAAAELDAPDTEKIGRDRLRLGRSHMFGRKNGLVLAYEDAVWVYQQTVRTYFVVTGRNLMVADVRGKITLVYSAGRRGEEELRSVMQEIARHNPAVRFGFTKENRAAWQEIVKARKAS